MAKYQTKPEPVEARQFLRGRSIPVGAQCNPECCGKTDGQCQQPYYVQTPEGLVDLDEGDWVITRPSGHYDVMSDEDFREKHDRRPARETV